MIIRITPQNELGVAIWLAKNTKLKIEQIHTACPNIHPYKIILLQRGGVVLDQEAINPIENNLCSMEDLEDGAHQKEFERMYTELSSNQKRLISSHLKQYIPGAIVWIANQNPHLKFAQIGKMFSKSPQFVSKLLRSDPLPQPVDPFARQLLTREIFDQHSNPK